LSACGKERQIDRSQPKAIGAKVVDNPSKITVLVEKVGTRKKQSFLLREEQGSCNGRGGGGHAAPRFAC
jgi:hypothetical protein